MAGPPELLHVITGQSPEPGIEGAIMQRDGAFSGPVNTTSVSSFDEPIGGVVTNGGSTVVAKMAIPA
jgi:hypothetical protein